MNKWFNELAIGDIIAQSKFKAYANGMGYFDDNDCDYLRIDKIKKGIIYTTNLATKATMELWCGEGWDDWAKKPSFRIVKEYQPRAVKPTQLSIFEMI